MCKCFTRQAVKSMGLTFTILYGLICIPCIVISGLNYWYTDLSWKDDGAWRYLSGLQVGAVVSVFWLFMMGIINFTCAKECKTYQIIFTILHILCTMLALGVGITLLVGGTIDKNNLTSNCKREYKGMFEDFIEVDEVLKKADIDLCGSNCPCYFSKYGAYEEIANETGSSENIHIDDNGFKNVKECYDKKKSLEVTDFIGKDKLFNDKRFKKFAKFWKRIEEKFDCTGWCTTSIKKYLFSDVSRGVPDHKCSSEVTGWLVRMVLAYGGLMVIVGGVMIVVTIIAIADVGDCHKNGPMYAPNHNIKNSDNHGFIGGANQMSHSKEPTNINVDNVTAK